MFLNSPESGPKPNPHGLILVGTLAREARSLTSETEDSPALTCPPAAGKHRRRLQHGPGALQERSLGILRPSPPASLPYFDIRSSVIKWDRVLIYWVKSFLPLLKNVLLFPRHSWEFRM